MKYCKLSFFSDRVLMLPEVEFNEFVREGLMREELDRAAYESYCAEADVDAEDEPLQDDGTGTGSTEPQGTVHDEDVPSVQVQDDPAPVDDGSSSQDF